MLMMKVAKERLSWEQKKKPSGNKPDVSFRGFVDLKNPAYLLHLFQQREEMMITQLQGQMDRDMGHAGGNLPLFEVWQKRVSDQIQSVSKAYLERVCLEQFLLRIKNDSDKSFNFMLEKLAVLFALDAINTDIGWFLTNQVITLEQGNRLLEVIRELCGKGTTGLADQGRK